VICPTEISTTPDSFVEDEEAAGGGEREGGGVAAGFTGSGNADKGSVGRDFPNNALSSVSLNRRRAI